MPAARRIAVNTPFAKGTRYLDALRAVGLACRLLPPTTPHPERKLAAASGLLLIGGPDYPPRLYGQTPDPAAGLCLMDDERAEFDMWLARAAMHRRLPTLGICAGCQLINIARGGALVQDIHTSLKHDGVHDISVVAGTVLARWLGEPRITVNSRHHQAVCRLGGGVSVSARAADGTIEGIEAHDASGRLLAVGVQWHPEDIYHEHPPSRRVFQAFAEWTHSQ